jgi:hypothetical protein
MVKLEKRVLAGQIHRRLVCHSSEGYTLLSIPSAVELPGRPIIMPKLFLSYRREDSKHITGHIHEYLEQHYGSDNVFFDVDAVPFGVDFRAYLDQAVRQCDIMLAVIADYWLEICYSDGPRRGQRRLDDTADFVHIELKSALNRGIPVVPVLNDGVRMPCEAELPQGLKELAYRQAAEVRSGRDFRENVRKLIEETDRLLQEREEQKRKEQEAAQLRQTATLRPEPESSTRHGTTRSSERTEPAPIKDHRP